MEGRAGEGAVRWVGGGGYGGELGEGCGEGLRLMGEEDRGDEGRPIEPGHLCEAVHYCVCAGPGEVGRVGGRASLNVVWRVVEDEIAICLYSWSDPAVRLELACSEGSKGLAHLGKAIPVKDKGVQQLTRRQRHQHPAAPPPRPLLEPALILQRIVQKFEGSCDHVYSYCDAQLMRGTYTQGKSCETGPDRWGHSRGQGPCNARVPPAEWCGIL